MKYNDRSMKYEALLKQHNLSVTKKRVLLLTVLETSRGPMTIDEIKTKLGTSMDVSTIYRSLKKLVDVGVIYQTDFRDGASYFEFQKEHHHHVVCTNCKKRSSIHLCATTDLKTVEEKTGFTVTNHIFELFGLCENCS